MDRNYRKMVLNLSKIWNRIFDTLNLCSCSLANFIKFHRFPCWSWDDSPADHRGLEESLQLLVKAPGLSLCPDQNEVNPQSSQGESRLSEQPNKGNPKKAVCAFEIIKKIVVEQRKKHPEGRSRVQKKQNSPSKSETPTQCSPSLWFMLWRQRKCFGAPPAKHQGKIQKCRESGPCKKEGQSMLIILQKWTFGWLKHTKTILAIVEKQVSLPEDRGFLNVGSTAIAGTFRS